MGLWIQNFKQALRGLRHQGWQAVVSVVGLAVSIVCLTFSVNWLWTETHYDSFRPDYKDLYVLERTDEQSFQSHYFSYSQIVEADSILGDEVQVGIYSLRDGKDAYSLPDRPEDVFLAQGVTMDAAMFDVLGVKVLSGSLDRVKAGDYQYVITESMAKRLFGRTDVAGEMIFRERSNSSYTVAAVVEDCEKESNIYYDFIVPLRLSQEQINNKRNQWLHVIFRTPDAGKTKRQMERVSLPEEWNAGTKFVLTPLRLFHKMEEGGTFLQAYFYPLAFVVISLLLVLGAWANFIVVYTSIFLGRTREYALRRSLGASDGRNACWMLTEATPVVVMGILVAAMGMEWLRYDGLLAGSPVYVYKVFAIVSVSVLVFCLVGMVYPVRKMRRVYRRSFAGQSLSGRSHAWLLVVQCFACAFLLFLSLGMRRQLSGMINSDLGFDRQNILRLYTGWKVMPGMDATYNYRGIFEDLPGEFRKEAGAGIVDAIAMDMDIFSRVTYHKIEIMPEEQWMSMKDKISPYGVTNPGEEIRRAVYVEFPYRAMDFFRIRTEHGKKLAASAEQDGALQVLFNRASMELFGDAFRRGARLYTGGTPENANSMTDWNRPVHYAGKWLQVQDVVDIRLNDFHQGEEPLMLVGVPEDHDCFFVEHDAVYVRYAPGHRADAEAAIRRVLEKFGVPEERIVLSSLDEYISGHYKEETYYANLLSALTVFSVLITFSGVFSMLLYSLRLRRRSMAIRRVMGAGFRDVFRPQLRSYLLYVVAGGVLAYFPAALLMHKWMEYFHYGETPGVGLMAAIVCGICVVVSLIVYGQVRHCMNDKPVEVLRPES